MRPPPHARDRSDGRKKVGRQPWRPYTAGVHFGPAPSSPSVPLGAPQAQSQEKALSAGTDPTGAHTERLQRSCRSTTQNGSDKALSPLCAQRPPRVIRKRDRRKAAPDSGSPREPTQRAFAPISRRHCAPSKSIVSMAL